MDGCAIRRGSASTSPASVLDATFPDALADIKTILRRLPLSETVIAWAWCGGVEAAPTRLEI